MPSNQNEDTTLGKAETAFREAFIRIKKGEPHLLPKNTQISQNNIAREAGCDPSALKKSRFPRLVAEIQQWIKESKPPQKKPASQKSGCRQQINQLKNKIKTLTIERDRVTSLLIEADSKILELTNEKKETKK